jgi:ABC-type uncharacterized transport system involved in gliding motility auxiliary subunit
MEKISKILAAIGFIAAIAGLIANDVLIDFTTYFKLIEGFALICFIAYFLINLNLIKAFSKKRAAKYGASSILGVIVFIAILATVNVISRYNVRNFDWTKSSIYSLSAQTQKVLENLNNDITITAFFKKNTTEKTVMENYINLYKDYTDKITIDFIDPDLKPSIAKQYKIKSVYTTIFESGDKEYRITPAGRDGLENLITNAIVKVSREKKKNIYFVVDHSERSVEDQAPIGLSFAKEHLEGLNYNVTPLSLLKEGKIPDDCDVLVIADPRRSYMDKELALFDDYVYRNGKFVFLIDTTTEPSIINYLSGFGIHANNDIIIDKGSQLFGGDLAMPFVIKYHAEEPITKGFNVSTLFPVARSIAFRASFETWRKWVPLAETNPFPNVWAETDIKNLKKPEFDKTKDLPGPLELVGIFTYDKGLELGEKQHTPIEDENACEMVIFGDSDFASNVYFNFFGNADFFTNTINYLARELDLISITPKKAGSSSILLTESQQNMLYYVAIYALPVVIFITGIIVWLRRRNL